MYRSIPYLHLAVIHTRALLRNPVCMLLALSTVVLTLILPLAFAHTFGNTAARLARDGGLAFQWMAGIAIAAYAACSITGRERKSGTGALTLTKPVSPAMLFLARYAGITAVLALFSTAAGTASLLAERIAETFTPATGYRIDLATAGIAMLCIGAACAAGAILNHRRNTSFHAAVFCLLPLLLVASAGLTGFYDRGGAWVFPAQYTLNFSIIPSALLIGAALAVFAAIALTLSLFLTPVSVAAACFATLAAGLAVEWLIAQSLARAPACRLVLALIPDWQLFWSASGSLSTPLPVVSATILYAFLYTATILTTGCLLFNHSEHA